MDGATSTAHTANESPFPRGDEAASGSNPKPETCSLMPRPEGPLLEIFGGDLVHPVLEFIHDLFLWGILHRLFEDDAGLLYHFVGGEDLRSRADS